LGDYPPDYGFIIGYCFFLYALPDIADQGARLPDISFDFYYRINILVKFYFSTVDIFEAARICFLLGIGNIYNRIQPGNKTRARFVFHSPENQFNLFVPSGKNGYYKYFG
jgi:hypothetical protein